MPFVFCIILNSLVSNVKTHIARTGCPLLLPYLPAATASAFTFVTVCVTPFVAGNITEVIHSMLPGVHMPALSVCRHISADSVKTMEDTVLRLYRYVAEIKMKAKFKHECGLTHKHYVPL